MPSATVPGQITAPDTATALQKKLGGDYEVSTQTGGSLDVRHGPLALATVRLRGDADATTFSVHGSGLILNRIVNEFGIARRVTSAISEAFAADRTA